MNSNDSLTKELVDRYSVVTRPDLSPDQWHRQKKLGKGFYRQHDAGTSAHLTDMLLGRFWIACRAAEGELIEWLSFDVDAKNADDDVRKRYTLLRTIMGVNHTPLVYQTPSGGLRVRFRIPPTPIGELIEAPGVGLVADVLRAGGLHPRQGYLEIFPQRGQPDRLPLGARMPLLDPESLRVLPGCAIGDTFDLATFVACLEQMESWHKTPASALLERLRTAPRRGEIRIVKNCESDTATESHFIRAEDGSVHLSRGMADLVNGGLQRPSSRFQSEFLVAMAMGLKPGDFRGFGLDRLYTPQQLAFAVAGWLAENHNGHSHEWSASMARLRSREAVINHWARRYLEISRATRMHMIDRVMRAIHAADPLSHRVRQLTHEEWAFVFELGNRHFPKGSKRLRFETWTAAFIRGIKEIMHYHEALVRRPGKRTRYEALADGGKEWVRLEYSADWQESMAFGSGGRGGPTPYLKYRAVLERENLVLKVARHRCPAAAFGRHPADTTGQATLYKVRRPMEATLRDVYIAPWLLQPACAGMTVGNGACTLDHAYHAFAALATGANLRQRYGYSAAKNLRERADDLTANLSQLRAHPVDLIRHVA